MLPTLWPQWNPVYLHRFTLRRSDSEGCETDSGEEGTPRGHGVVNSSAYDVEIVTFTELNEDGTEMSTLTGPATLRLLQDVTVPVRTVSRITNPTSWQSSGCLLVQHEPGTGRL